MTSPWFSLILEYAGFFFLLKIFSGADLISIHNEEENTFILDSLKKQWKGPEDILLGMFYDTDGKLYLSCGTWPSISFLSVTLMLLDFKNSVVQVQVQFSMTSGPHFQLLFHSFSLNSSVPQVSHSSGVKYGSRLSFCNRAYLQNRAWWHQLMRLNYWGCIYGNVVYDQYKTRKCIHKFLNGMKLLNY